MEKEEIRLIKTITFSSIVIRYCNYDCKGDRAILFQGKTNAVFLYTPTHALLNVVLAEITKSSKRRRYFFSFFFFNRIVK